MGRGQVLLAVLVGFCWTGLQVLPAAAQETPRAIILTLDQERLFSNSLFGERTTAQLEADAANLARENRNLEEDLTAEELDLTEQRKTLEPEAFRLLADAFDEKVQGIRQAQDAKSRAFSRRLESERAVFYNLALPLLGEIMKERGAVAILNRQAIFISASTVDITDEALRRIDATLGSGAGAVAPADTPENTPENTPEDGATPTPAPTPTPVPQPVLPQAPQPQE